MNQQNMNISDRHSLPYSILRHFTYKEAVCNFYAVVYTMSCAKRYKTHFQGGQGPEKSTKSVKERRNPTAGLPTRSAVQGALYKESGLGWQGWGWGSQGGMERQ